MLFEIITLNPLLFESFFKTGLMKRAVANQVLSYTLLGLRKYGEGRLKKVDDTPYGGNAGMLLKTNVLGECLAECKGEQVVLMSPRGKVLTRSVVKSLLAKNVLTFISGYYEGVDQRFIDKYVDEEISIGDYVLVNGDLACQVVIEAISRYLPGFMNNPGSVIDESFEDGLLEYDQYTKPLVARNECDQDEGVTVPTVLQSGNHQAIRDWNHRSALINTYRRRPDLFKKKNLNKNQENLIKGYFYNQLKIKHS